MAISSPYVLMVSMDIDPDREALFNEIYDQEHVPNVLKVPGVHSATRVHGEPFTLAIGGEGKEIAHEGAAYCALYEIDGPHVLTSPEWAEASEAGRWPQEVRPYARNRRIAVYRVR